MLLLESDDWQVINNQAVYLAETNDTIYDYFFFCRLKSNIKKQLPKNIHNLEDVLVIQNLLQINAQIVGWLSNRNLATIISEDYFLPQNSYLNGKTRMDANNYYVQSGCLRILTA